MKYLILCGLILLHPIHAAFLEPKPEIFPLEFELLLKFVQTNSNDNELKEVLNTIRIIDTEGEKLTQEELMFVTKTEVYKSLLKAEDNKPIVSNFNYTSLINILKDSRIKYKKHAFLLWLTNSLIEDLSNIVESTAFKDLMLIKKSGTALSPELLKIDRKLFLVTKLAQEITNTTESVIPVGLVKKAQRTLENVRIAFQILAKYGRTTSAPPKPLASGAFHFFVERSSLNKNDNNAQPAKTNDKDEKSIDQILAPVIEGKTQDLPKPVDDKDWRPGENAKKDLPKPVNDTEWLPDN